MVNSLPAAVRSRETRYVLCGRPADTRLDMEMPASEGEARQEIEGGIARAEELRALRAAFLQGNPPSHFSGRPYPLFTPSYEDEPAAAYQQTVSSWNENHVKAGPYTDIVVPHSHSRKGLTFAFANPSLHSHLCPADDNKSVNGSGADNTTVLQTSPATNGNDCFKSGRRNSLDDFNSLSSCNRCQPLLITAKSENSSNADTSTVLVPLVDSRLSLPSQPKSKGVISWLFPRLKKKHNKNETSPNRTESEEVSQVLKDLGNLSIEALKKELIEANENRDAALMEVSEMKSSFGELKQRLEYLESYCEELKKALRLAKDCRVHEKLNNLPERGKPSLGSAENVMPVSEEVLVEVFSQIVSEGRLSVKQFCKTLVSQIEETDRALTQNLNQLLQPFKLSLNAKYSKAVLYHFEAFVNQCLYQDYENCVFQKNGCPRFLDPRQGRQAHFSSFVALRNLSWNEVLRKGTKYYSEEFSKFCDRKMSCIITCLNWSRAWSEELLQAFFVAAKCIWLLHLLAYSFNPPFGILRVEENTRFDGHYMEDMCGDRQRLRGPSRVKMMVMPGFYVGDRVLRCKVLCRYKSAT
ncbi:IRK-interacting protein-like [Prosopis cineraria]|uniref:IRK-interacting protein-like n=1 Tax=Prosopis cineraria TaxID=364024 RepID=UPI0024108067|nr:IRK-interacting protein-like [Prosopis cineraria]